MDVHERVQDLERNHTKMEGRLSAIEQDEKSVHRRLPKLEDLESVPKNRYLSLWKAIVTA